MSINAALNDEGEAPVRMTKAAIKGIAKRFIKRFLLEKGAHKARKSAATKET